MKRKIGIIVLLVCISIFILMGAVIYCDSSGNLKSTAPVFNVGISKLAPVGGMAIYKGKNAEVSITLQNPGINGLVTGEIRIDGSNFPCPLKVESGYVMIAVENFEKMLNSDFEKSRDTAIK